MPRCIACRIVIRVATCGCKKQKSCDDCKSLLCDTCAEKRRCASCVNLLCEDCGGVMLLCADCSEFLCATCDEERNGLCDICEAARTVDGRDDEFT